MQFGIFGLGMVDTDPVTGRVVDAAQRLRDHVVLARRAEQVGLDVFALGEHPNSRTSRRRRRWCWQRSPRRRQCSP